MSKLFNSISSSMPTDDTSIEEWNSATRDAFTPFFENSTSIDKNIQLLRVELRNLARILNFPEYIELLHWTINLYRAQLKIDKDNTCAYLASKIHLVEKSDSTWFSLFQISQELPSDTTAYDRVFQIFSTIDSVLEGCYKPRFELLYAFSTKAANGQFPKSTKRLDFGNMKAEFPNSYATRAQLFLSDPLFNIGVNQWRNIGAHKTFQVFSEGKIEVNYGMRVPPKSLSISLEQLRAILAWIFRTHTVARMASEIIYLENMSEIKPYMASMPNVRFEQSLTHLCHNLKLVGFRCSNLDKSQGKISLTLHCTSDKDQTEAVIHASQILDQLALAVEFDQLTIGKYDICEVKVFSVSDKYLGSANVKYSDAIEWTKGQFSLEEYVKLVSIHFIDHYRES
ncbi:MAG: hypothetical protein H6657_03225 [Ardenticatenaceae bacterium]|nr:hypothetical protein [Ardenticatenaceae bacterium]